MLLNLAKVEPKGGTQSQEEIRIVLPWQYITDGKGR
jgi:hypothetical protein